MTNSTTDWRHFVCHCHDNLPLSSGPTSLSLFNKGLSASRPWNYYKTWKGISHSFEAESYFFVRLSGVGSRGQQIQHPAPSFPFPGRISQLWFGDPKAFLSQVGDVFPPPAPRSAPGPPPRWTCLVHLSREAPNRHPTQMPEPPQLTPFDAQEQRLYSEFLSDN